MHGTNRVALPTWEEALATLDQDEDPSPAAVLHFGRRLDVKGIIAPSEDATRAVQYLTKYLTKGTADAYRLEECSDVAYHAYVDRLHHAVRYLLSSAGASELAHPRLRRRVMRSGSEAPSLPTSFAVSTSTPTPAEYGSPTAPPTGWPLRPSTRPPSRSSPTGSGSQVVPRKVVRREGETVLAVRNASPGRYGVVVTLGAGLGLRQGEVFGLSPDDVDSLRGRVEVRRQVKVRVTRAYPWVRM